MTRLILCADDYGLAPGVSRAIVRLIAAGRVSATSCITVSRFWPGAAVALRPHAERADIGLHLTLTDMPPLGALPELAGDGRLPSPGALLVRAFMRRLDRAEVEAELERQLDAFEAALDRPPRFLDGHLHVHQLPVVRDAVIALWQRRLARSGAWLRICDAPAGAIWRRGVAVPKALVIAGFGRALRRRAVSAGIPVNDRFAGIHDFSRRRPYRELFDRFIADASPARGDERLVVMCHPGEVDEDLKAADPVTAAREDELRFFESPAYLEALARRGLTPGRFA